MSARTRAWLYELHECAEGRQPHPIPTDQPHGWKTCPDRSGSHPDTIPTVVSAICTTCNDERRWGTPTPVEDRWGALASEQVPGEIFAMFDRIEISDDLPANVAELFSDLPDGRVIQEEVALGETVQVEWEKCLPGQCGYHYTATRIVRGSCWWLAHREQIESAPDLVVVYEALGHWWEWWPRSKRLHSAHWYAPQKLDPALYLKNFGMWLEPLPVERVSEMLATAEGFGEDEHDQLASVRLEELDDEDSLVLDPLALLPPSLS
jgi:hypothetical protein